MGDEAGKSGGEGTDQFGAPAEEGGAAQQVFSSAVKTVTFNNGYKNDGSDPSFKMLNAAGLDSSQVFSGIPAGTKQVVIRGNSAHHYLKNRFTHVDLNDTLQVDGQQSETIEKDTRHLYKANFLRGVSGNDHLRVNGLRDLIVLGESSEQYVGKHEVTAPEEFEWKSFERGFSFTKIDVMGIGWDLHGAEIETFGANVGVGVETADGSVFHQEIKLTHEHAPLFHTKEGIEVDALLRVDALLDVGLGTPFR